MNLKIQRILKTILFWSLLIGIIFATGHFTRPLDKETSPWPQYYKYDKNTIDVVLAGSSATYRYWAPYQAYEEKGFTSTCVWAAAQDWKSAPYMLEEALKTQNPDLVVMEVRMMLRLAEEPYWQKKQINKQHKTVNFHTRYTMSGMRLSPTKLRMIQDIFGDQSWEKRFEMAVPLLGYHETILESSLGDYVNRAKKSQVDFTNDLMITSVRKQKWTDVEEWDELELSQEAIDYLEMIVDLCEKNHTKVMFLLSPFIMTELDQEIEAQVARYMEEKGYDYLNLNPCIEEIGLLYDKDFYNSGHVNIAGAVKYTTYLENYIADHYSITSNLNQKQKAYWDSAVETWHSRKDKKMEQWTENLKGETEDESESESNS